MKALKNTLVTLILGLLSVVSMAESSGWLVRLSSSVVVPEEAEAVVIMSFGAGDRLVRLSDIQAQWLQQALMNDQVRYLVPDDPLDIIPDKKSEFFTSMVSEEPEDFLAINGFDKLSSSQRSCSGVSLAILDSGLDVSHERLSSVILDSAFDVLTGEVLTTDPFGHGTHIAGLIAASDNGEWSGVCTSATLMPIRFLNQSGGGRITDAIVGIQWAIEHHARILNHSWTVLNNNAALLDAITAANEAGILQVMAAGNLGSNLDDITVYPAGYARGLDGAIVVGNWDADTADLYSTSNYGLDAVDIAASGTRLLSLAPGGGDSVRTGTSMAAPLIAAAAAMLMEQTPDASAAEIRARLSAGCLMSDSVADSVRCGGHFYMPESLATGQQPSAIFRHAEVDTQVVLEGIGLDTVREWRYFSWLDGQEEVLTPVSASDRQVVFAQPAVPGEWRWSSGTNHVIRYPYAADLGKPSDLVVQRNGDQVLVAWNGVEGADLYRIETDINLTGFSVSGEVADPVSQWVLTAQPDDLVRVRVIASRSYRMGGVASGKRVTASSVSEVVSSGADGALWQTLRYADIPVSADARLPVQLLAGADIDALTLEQQDGRVELGSDGVLIPDTSSVANVPVELSYQSGDISSQRLIELRIISGSAWHLLLDTSDELVFDSAGLDLRSVSLGIDGDIDLVVANVQSGGLVSVRIQESGRQFDEVSLGDGSSQAAIESSSDHRMLYVKPTAGDSSQTIRLKLATIDLATKSNSADRRCFIASVALQHYPDRLQSLRDVRDLLQRTPVGGWLVERYYQYSPGIAWYLDHHPLLRLPVTVMLWCVSWLVSPVGIALILILLASLMLGRRGRLVIR